MITVKDWMSRPVVVVKSDASVADAAGVMSRHNIGAVVVSDDGKKPKGIITERDFLIKVVQGRIDPEETTVDKIMSKKVMSVDVKTSLLEITKIMSKNAVRRLLVTDHGEMVGIVTSRDLLELMAS